MKDDILVLRAEIHVEEAVVFARRLVVDRHDGLLLGNGTYLLDQGFRVFVVPQPVAVSSVALTLMIGAIRANVCVAVMVLMELCLPRVYN